jgi:LAO/AO transport system kinase
MVSYLTLLKGIEEGDFKLLARALTLVENDIAPSLALLKSLKIKNNVPVLGITGPPGAGKSTLVNAIASFLVLQNKKIAILAVDPTSPFNFGSLLGDRIRMAAQFNNPNVYIRSIATRGALGGISVKTLEMLDVLKASNFDLIIVETVGVGQSEVEIAGLADKTMVVLVPESGDEIQNIKSGLMEIANAFVVNKADREGADIFCNNLKKLVNDSHQNLPVFKTVADKNLGIDKLCDWILTPSENDDYRKKLLVADKIFRIIQHKRMQNLDKAVLIDALERAMNEPEFNAYKFAEQYTKTF